MTHYFKNIFKSFLLNNDMKLIPYLYPSILMFNYSLKRKIFGFKKYAGNFEDISKQILESCYKESKQFPSHKYFRVSSGHFKQFYCRDFGMISEALIKLGYEKQVVNTLSYSLFVFKKYNKITTTISLDYPVNYFSISADSLPFLIRSIRLCIENKIDISKLKKYFTFLQKQINLYYETIFDLKTNLVRSDINLSSSKDHSKRKSSCYDNCCSIGLSIELRKINVLLKEKIFDFPLNIQDAKNKFINEFWNGKYFYDDLSKCEIITSDANIMPFYWNIIKDKSIKNTALDNLLKSNLDSFLPVKYSIIRQKEKELFFPELFAPNYEGDTYWLHLGLCYLEVLFHFDKKRVISNLDNIKNQTLKYKNFLEVFNNNKKPYSSWAYHCDESMSWIIGYLFIMKKLNLSLD